uniref:Uncharacterized protein LOC104225556 n=1 Tax=Nicotiana sylvestris TaxID=4096 RepID=A0A1U7WEK8_NICSY|nr:PREDICTED: uncharacterized protein LOC104225556 [Nicotiana sylvestris]
MRQELNALEDNGTWSLVDLPVGKVPIGCKWVFKIKYRADGEVKRYKARWLQKVRVVLALAATHSWNLHQMDVYNAFLQGDLTEEDQNQCLQWNAIRAEYDQHLELKDDEKLPDAGPYQRLVEKLLYLTMTRLDICYAVHVLSQFMHYPKKSHMEAAVRIVRYIKGALGLGLLMSSKSCPKLTAFVMLTGHHVQCLESL